MRPFQNFPYPFEFRNKRMINKIVLNTKDIFIYVGNLT